MSLDSQNCSTYCRLRTWGGGHGAWSPPVSTAKCEGSASFHVVSFEWRLCSILDRSVGVPLKLRSVYMLLRMSLIVTDSLHSCVKVETLWAAEPE